MEMKVEIVIKLLNSWQEINSQSWQYFANLAKYWQYWRHDSGKSTFKFMNDKTHVFSQVKEYRQIWYKSWFSDSEEIF